MDFYFRLKQLPSKTKKGPCIQSIGDGYRGLGDNLYDQRNAVIFSENAKKPRSIFEDTPGLKWTKLYKNRGAYRFIPPQVTNIWEFIFFCGLILGKNAI